MKQHLEPVSIAERLRFLMGTDTETSFARRVGISQDSIVRYLQGQIPDPTSLVRISDVCDVSPDWLLRGPTNDQKTPAPKAGSDRPANAVPPPVNLVLKHTGLTKTRD